MFPGMPQPAMVFRPEDDPKVREMIQRAKKWRSVYPAYLNSDLSQQEGRRLGKTKCVPGPKINELSECVKAMGFEFISEGYRSYSRDILQKGRIKIKMFDEDKKPLKQEFPSKRIMLRVLGERLVEYRAAHPIPMEKETKKAGESVVQVKASQKKGKNKKKH